MNEYRIANENERGDIYYMYDLLVGPNGFECLLTEPEDRSWYRDLKPVINELNRLNNIIKRLKKRTK